jgi:hypothetical protein
MRLGLMPYEVQPDAHQMKRMNSVDTNIFFFACGGVSGTCLSPDAEINIV